MGDAEIQTPERPLEKSNTMDVPHSREGKVDICSLEVVWVEWLNDRSRMNGDIHVRVCESLRGRFPWATRPDVYLPCCALQINATLLGN